MQKIILVLTIIFITLTFLGSGYVLANLGEVNAGYAIIPMVCALTCLVILKSRKNKK